MYKENYCFIIIINSFIILLMIIFMVKIWTKIKDIERDNLKVHEYILDKIGG